ncbi:MAG: peptidylprolyl isomerase [Chromatiaceae bacterium]|jgi:cyclophilin family peptidyl-prolyl cis-trans isomerase|nr:peptidylprolyl isomerase [Chromatiaceae bacterium]
MRPTLAGLLLALVASATPALADNPRVLLETSKGTITVELDAEKTPKSVEGFLGYVDAGFYDGTIFHRVIPDFMIQGGGYGEQMDRKETRAPIQNEADNGLKNDRGTLAMARTSNPHSATSQFFINLKDNEFLNHKGKSPQGWGYAVFGRVISGMEVVDAIAGEPTGMRAGMQDVPNTPIVIQRASRVTD